MSEMKARRWFPWAALLALAPLCRADAPAWPGSFVGRLEALALMQEASLEILGDTSATAALERWCASHHLAEAPRVAATVLSTKDPGADDALRARLEVGAEEPLRYRRVALRCGDVVLSIAENWYVPARLTDAMNAALATSDTPFGKVVRPLDPYRRTYRIAQLWSPLPEDWSRATPSEEGTGALVIPAALFEHRALLYTRAHVPFAEVHETYQRELLGAPPAGPP